MTLDDQEKAQMYRELLDIIDRPRREDCPEPNITCKEYAALRGISPGAAYRRLEKRVREGRLTKKCGIVIDNHPNCVYWKK